MKPDRELLELAAKAAGIRALRDPYGVLRDCTGMHPSQNIFAGEPWNPLEDDGDALRAMVKRRIKVRYNEALGQALAWPEGANESEALTVNVEDCDRDEYAATRRAIVRALAAIGEAL